MAEDNATIPDMRGKWTCVYRITDSEVTDLVELADGDPTFTFMIENQTGRIYEGYQTYDQPLLGKVMKEGIRGVITDDGKHFFEVGEISGQGYGDITGPDSFSYYYLHNEIPIGNETYQEARIAYGKFIRESSETTGSGNS